MGRIDGGIEQRRRDAKGAKRDAKATKKICVICGLLLECGTLVPLSITG